MRRIRHRDKRLVQMFNEQAGLCAYCEKPMSLYKQGDDFATRDHVKPKRLGGRSGRDNEVAACFECNQSKGHKRLMSEWIPPKLLL